MKKLMICFAAMVSMSIAALAGNGDLPLFKTSTTNQVLVYTNLSSRLWISYASLKGEFTTGAYIAVNNGGGYVMLVNGDQSVITNDCSRVCSPPIPLEYLGLVKFASTASITSSTNKIELQLFDTVNP